MNLTPAPSDPKAPTMPTKPKSTSPSWRILYTLPTGASGVTFVRAADEGAATETFKAKNLGVSVSFVTPDQRDPEPVPGGTFFKRPKP